MTNQRPERPAITQDESKMLTDLAPDFETVRGVLDDLEELGVNVEPQRASLDASERLRMGLLDKFPPRGRRRKAQ